MGFLSGLKGFIMTMVMTTLVMSKMVVMVIKM